MPEDDHRTLCMKSLFFQRLRKRPCNFRQICGVSLQIFQQMLIKLRPDWDKLMASKKPAGRSSLCLEDELLMLLIYYRVYASMNWIGLLFQLDASNICRHIQRFERLFIRQFHIKKERTMSADEAQLGSSMRPKFKHKDLKINENKRKIIQEKRRNIH